MQTQEVDIKPNIKVFMRSDSEMLDEVMVVAYGTAKKSAFTGSASVIKSETLEKRQVSTYRMHFPVLYLVCRHKVQMASRVRVRQFVFAVSVLCMPATILCM